MLPDFSALYHANKGFRYLVIRRYFFVGAVVAANVFNLFFCQLGAPMFFTSMSNQTPLGVHVIHIVFVGSKEQMRQVDTCPVVAFVQYMLAVRNRSARHFPSNPMNLFGNPIDTN